MTTPPRLLRRLFDAAVGACHPSRVIPAALPERPSGNVIVIGAGKAAAAMAAAIEAAWGPPLKGVVVTRYGHGVRTRFIEVVEAGHPLPDSAGANVAQRALDLAREAHEGDKVVVLLSGGGSALWGLPIAPLSLAEKKVITNALVKSSASISEINCVRKHLSRIKGGRLAAVAHPARTLTLAISDVPGDDASVIASGPTVADESTQTDALQVFEKYGVAIPDSARAVLSSNENETIKTGDPRLLNTRYKLVARGADGLAAAADEAHKFGIETRILGVDLEGDARAVAIAHAEIARDAQGAGRPIVLLSGGELTLTVTGQGRGGPNREYLLALAQSLNGAANIWALAADTDGIDGSDECAGGWIGPDTLEKARGHGIDPALLQRDNDSAAFFAKLDQAVVTGPTRTNVNDFRAILVTPGV
jgi:hydroxypyruvate reductase